jgi:UDP-glucose 4-epimerase
MNKTLLVTGGAGFLGSHTYVALVNQGYHPILLDNFSNSNPKVLSRLAQICGAPAMLVEGDLRDRALLDKLFSEHKISAVIHFAALKAVGESSRMPLEYYDNNVGGTLTLLAAMRQADVKNLVFSSSATVYGDGARSPIQEDAPRSATNPYGRTKLVVEDILQELSTSDASWNIARLRYFNPIGAHESGLIGEDPVGVPNNLLPYVAQVAAGRRAFLHVFGNDYPTVDGTGVRDYIHVMDLAEGHVAALRYFETHTGLLTVNLGTGSGVSVLQLIAAFKHASGRRVPYEVVARRAGDVAECWADPALASRKLGWTARRSLQDMCTDAWRWQSNNPLGFSSDREL